MCKLKGGWKRVDGKGGIMMCKLGANEKSGWIRLGIMWKSNCGCKRGHYNVQNKNVDR